MVVVGLVWSKARNLLEVHKHTNNYDSLRATYLIEEHILTILSIVRKILQHTAGRYTVLLAQSLPEFKTNYTFRSNKIER